MVKNPGKRFESDVFSSVTSDMFVHRLKDSAQAYNNSKQTSFTWNNECDFFIYKKPCLFAIECKSTKYKSMSVQIDKEDDGSKMIKYHQINSLMKMSGYDGVFAGFLFNFRDEKNNCERTYWQEINDFCNMIQQLNKKSFNELDIIMHKAIKLQGEIKRTHYKWDIKKLLDDIAIPVVTHG